MAPRKPTIDQLKAGDESAWVWLMDTYAGQIAGYARRMGCSDPEDITGATLEGVARGIGGFFGSHGQLRSWIFSIAHARIVDDLRRRQRRPEIGFTGIDLPDDQEPGPRADSEAMQFDVSEPRLEEALARLTEEQKALLHLRYVTELSTKEIARVTGRSEVATRVALHRSSKRLRELLGGPAEVAVGAA